MKERLDVLLVKRNLADSREKAKAVIMAGNVFVEGQGGKYLCTRRKYRSPRTYSSICQPGRTEA